MELLIDILCNSILITGLVVIMMMMIESFNIESHGKFFAGLRKNRFGQVLTGALLGSIPGCMGGFATVSLYTHKMMSLGALIAMMIASSGDEAFIMIAMLPDQVWWIFALLFVIAIAGGWLTDLINDSLHRRKCGKASHSECGDEMRCDTGYEVHEIEIHKEDAACHHHDKHTKAAGNKKIHWGWHRILMLLGTALFIAALAGGMLGHEHGHEGHEHGHEHTECVEVHNRVGIDLLSEDWMNVLFAVLSLVVLVVLFRGSDHFVEEHLWKHIVVKHLPSIFAWTFGVLAIMGILLQHMDISAWISDNTALMILLAVAIGMIPESGPHLIFISLYASGVVPLPVLLASCISQDGHASIPLLAESKISFAKAKLINCLIALIAGFGSTLFV